MINPRHLYDIVQSAIALMVVVGFLCVITWALWFGIPDDGVAAQGTYLLIGGLNTAIGMVVQFYFRHKDHREQEEHSKRLNEGSTR